MELLKQRILKDGKSCPGGILKVDSFINHQLDAELMYEMAKEFAARFKGSGFNKIITVEASGIAPAIMLGYYCKLPVVFIKKKKPSTMANMAVSSVHSFTKGVDYTVCVSKDFLGPEDKVLFVDDFLAMGNAALGVIDLAKQCGATISGMGFIIEKGFQGGRKLIEKQGIHVESLAIIDSLDDCEIVMR